MGVSEYQLVAAISENLRGSLPTIEELEAEYAVNLDEGSVIKKGDHIVGFTDMIAAKGNTNRSYFHFGNNCR